MASNVRPLWHFSAPSITLAIFWWCHSNVSQKTVATKKKLSQCYLAPWHCQTTWKVLGNCLQRMEGRGRGSLSSPISLSYLHLATLGAVPIPWKLQPFLEAAECHGRLHRHLLPLLGGRPMVVSPMLPSGDTWTHACCTQGTLLCPRVSWGVQSIFSVGRQEDTQPSSSFAWVTRSERPACGRTGSIGVSATAVTLNTR